LIDTDAWEIISRKSFAHIGSPAWWCENITSDPTYSAPPIYYVSRDKHGIYLTGIDCNNDVSCDNCLGDRMWYYDGEYDYSQYLKNVGSNSYANSPYIDRYIWDSSQQCWVNLWDGVDFPHASPYIGSYKFATYPSHSTFTISGIYQPGGPAVHLTDNISGLYPNPVGDIKFQGTNLSLIYRDGFVNLFLADVIGGLVGRKTAVGRVKIGSRPIRVLDTVWGTGLIVSTPQALYGIIRSTYNSERQTSALSHVYVPDGGYYYPDISSVTVMSSTSIRIIFTVPVNLTQNSVKLMDNSTGQVYLGTVSPVVTMFGGGVQNFYTTYYFTPSISMQTRRRYSLWITKQDVISGIDAAVLWTYFQNPYYIQDVSWLGKSSVELVSENAGTEDGCSWAQFELSDAGWVDAWVEDEAGNKEQIKSSENYFVPAGAKQLLHFNPHSDSWKGKVFFRVNVKSGGAEKEMLISTDGVKEVVRSFSARDEFSATTLSSNSTLPRSFSLCQNFPNPFNPSTSISFDIPENRAPSVSLKVFNVRGQLVKQLVNSSVRQSGRYTVFWDGNDQNGMSVPSGVYFYRLTAGEYNAVRKMVLLK